MNYGHILRKYGCRNRISQKSLPMENVVEAVLNSMSSVKKP